MKVSRSRALALWMMALSLPACNASRQTPRNEAHKVTVTTARAKAVTLTQQYACQIHSRHHIDVRTPADGYLAAIPIREGQEVKWDDLLFRVRPLVGKEGPGKESEENATSIKAPFDGEVGRLPRQQGSFVQKGEALTTLSDNNLIRADFSVPEFRYLEYMALSGQNQKGPDVELMLADGSKLSPLGKLGAIGAEFKAGNVSFSADFPNPDHRLHHGQTGTVLIHHVQQDAIVIPQRATHEVLDKRYVFVVDKDHVAHDREIVVESEAEDLFVVGHGVEVGDKIVLDGMKLVHDGDKVEYEDLPPKKVVGDLKPQVQPQR